MTMKMMLMLMTEYDVDGDGYDAHDGDADEQITDFQESVRARLQLPPINLGSNVTSVFVGLLSSLAYFSNLFFLVVLIFIALRR